MATLVFSAVGTALGGPVGGAIGSLLGQSFDQAIFGSRNRGPRLGDLTVQTSSYGTQIPKIYGTMRVAGSVIWATDLKESSTQTGAKGQPDTTVYSYSVSLAVALSSRPIASVKRIWADGKLLRGASGKFKVKTKYRLHRGLEDQDRDPLIASLEGIDETPAYRGLAIAVFEDLELADFGNRIPFLTFEVEADADAPAVATVLEDVSGGAIRATAPSLIQGYAAYGATIRASVEPIVEHFAVDLFDDGEQLRSAAEDATLALDEVDFGNSSSDASVARIERTQSSRQSLPVALTLSYYDRARDYQTGQMRASTGELRGPQQNVELAAVLTAEVAKAVAEASLARRWARRDKVTLRLPPRCIAIEPGSTVSLPMTPTTWTVERCEIDGMVAIVDLRPTWCSIDGLAADGGRFLPGPDVARGVTSVAAFDLPTLDGSPALNICAAASSSGAGWRPVALEITIGGQPAIDQSAARKSILGVALTSLVNGQSALLDLANHVDVELVDDQQWLESCDDDALVMGGNLAVLGRELLQFGSAVPIGPRRFRLSRLLRGRRGTEWAMAEHASGDAFALLATGTLKAFEVPRSAIGSIATVRPLGPEDENVVAVEVAIAGEGLKPPSPVRLSWRRSDDGGLEISWTRRSRYGWAWVDEVDAPLGEARELYLMTVAGAAQSIQFEANGPTATVPAATLATLGDSLELKVQQIGDFAASRPLTAVISVN